MGAAGAGVEGGALLLLLLLLLLLPPVPVVVIARRRTNAPAGRLLLLLPIASMERPRWAALVMHNGGGGGGGGRRRGCRALARRRRRPTPIMATVARWCCWRRGSILPCLADRLTDLEIGYSQPASPQRRLSVCAQCVRVGMNILGKQVSASECMNVPACLV